MTLLLMLLHVHVGASSDLEQATSIAKAMVTKYAMSDVVRSWKISFFSFKKDVDSYTCTLSTLLPGWANESWWQSQSSNSEGDWGWNQETSTGVSYHKCWLFTMCRGWYILYRKLMTEHITSWRPTLQSTSVLQKLCWSMRPWVPRRFNLW